MVKKMKKEEPKAKVKTAKHPTKLKEKMKKSGTGGSCSSC